MAEVLAHLLDCPLVGKEDFPAEALYPEHFNTSFLKGVVTLFSVKMLTVSLFPSWIQHRIRDQCLTAHDGKIAKVFIVVLIELRVKNNDFPLSLSIQIFTIFPQISVASSSEMQYQ
ncbi:hypothetical protein [Kiloniella majae]|uniref:hypothetical protein n=1 Tax=Kiloniella majae TaxID=1938558 RepID=UPI000F7A3779|nr:hypothetical protein [Kiloniella majae]